jgi:hypothetical protein
MPLKTMIKISNNLFSRLSLKVFFFSFLYITLHISVAHAITLSVNSGSYGCGGKIYFNVTGGTPNTTITWQWTNSKGVWYSYQVPLPIPGNSSGPLARTDASGNGYAVPGNPSSPPPGYPLGSYPDVNGISTCTEDDYSGEYWYCGTYSVHVKTGFSAWSNTVSFSYNCECIEGMNLTLNASVPTCSVGAPAQINLDWDAVTGANLFIVERAQGAGAFAEVKKCGSAFAGGDPNCFYAWADKTVTPGIAYRYRVRAFEGQCRMQFSNYSNIVNATSGVLPACTCATKWSEVDCTGFPVDSYRCTSLIGREQCDRKSDGLTCWHPVSDCDATCETCAGSAGSADCQVKACSTFPGTFGDCTGNSGKEKCKDTTSCTPSLERYHCQSMGPGTCPDCWRTELACNGLTSGSSSLNGWCKVSNGACSETAGCDGGGITGCDLGEDAFNCPADCSGVCAACNNNTICEAGETCANCPSDCSCAPLPCTGPTLVPTLAVSWSDNPLTPGVLVRDDHFSELKANIDRLRSNASMPLYPWATCGSAGTGFHDTSPSRISANLINCPREALRQLYDTCCANQGGGPACTKPSGIVGSVATGSPIRAQHVNDLRSTITSINFIKRSP